MWFVCLVSVYGHLYCGWLLLFIVGLITVLRTLFGFALVGCLFKVVYYSVCGMPAVLFVTLVVDDLCIRCCLICWLKG